MGLLIFIRIFVDIFVLGIISLSCIIINKYGTPYQRGYFLDDESIQYPYEAGTVSFYDVIIIGTVGPTFVIVLVELAIYIIAEKMHHAPPVSITAGRNIPGVLVTIYQYVGMLWIGLATTEICTDIPKMLIGRLRPHFLAVCQPDVSKLNTTTMTGYIVDDICTGENAHAIDAARRSFPSGHSSFAAFPAAYLALYLTYRLRPWSALRMPVFLVSCVLFNLTIYVACTRISDYKHHWTDVVAGLGIGVFVVMAIAYLYGGKRFHMRFSSTTRNTNSDVIIDNPIFRRQEMNSSEPF